MNSVKFQINDIVKYANNSKKVIYKFDYTNQKLICDNAKITGFYNKKLNYITIHLEENIFKTEIYSKDKSIIEGYKSIRTYVYNIYNQDKDLKTIKDMKHELIDLISSFWINHIIRKRKYIPFHKMKKADLIAFYQHEIIKKYV